MGLLIELSGWLGALTVIVAYACSALGWIGGTRLFHGCNLIGSAALFVNAWHHGALPAMFVNIAWCSISALGMMRASGTQGTVLTPEFIEPGPLEADGLNRDCLGCADAAQ